MGLGLFDIDEQLGGGVIIPEQEMEQLISGGVEVKPENLEVKPEEPKTGFVDKTLADMGISTELPTIPKQPSVIIRDLGNALTRLEDEGRLKERGKNVLSSLRKGGFLDPSIGVTVQGATMGTSDEMIALFEQFSKKKEYGDVVKLLSEGVPYLYGKQPVYMSPYSVSTGIQRAEMEAFKQDYPKTAFGLDIAGSIGTAGAIDKATKASGIFKDASKLGELTGKSGLYGGIAGFGYAEGDPTQQLLSSGAGTILGTGAGLAFGLASPVISAGFEKTIDAFTPPKFFESREAKKFLKETLERGYGSVDEALLDFANRSTGKKYTIDQLEKAKQVFSDQGSTKPFTIADLDDETRSLLDIFRQLPTTDMGSARKWFKNRRNGQMERLQTDVKQAFGRTGEIFSEINAINKLKSSVGADYYKSAFKINVKPEFKYNIKGGSVSLQDMFKTPQFQEAFQKANYLAQTKSYGVGKDFLQYTLLKDGTVMKNGKILKAIPSEFLHNMKMGLDDAIDSYMNTEGYKGNILRSYLDSKNMFLQMFDKANPRYKSARNFYAGLKGTEDAYTKGLNLFSTRSDDLYTRNPNHSENITLLIDGMSEAEKEAFRSGAVRSIIDKLGGMVQQGEEVLTSKDFTRYFITDPSKLRLIRATFGDNQQGFQDFVKNIRIESDMYNTYRALQGSQTQPRTEAMKKVIEAQYDTNTNITNKVMNFLNRNAQDVNERQIERINAEVVSYLSTFNKREILKIFDSLNDSNAQKAYNAISDLIMRSRNAVVNPYVLGQGAGQFGTNVQQNTISDPFPNRTEMR